MPRTFLTPTNSAAVDGVDHGDSSEFKVKATPMIHGMGVGNTPAPKPGDNLKVGN